MRLKNQNYKPLPYDGCLVFVIPKQLRLSLSSATLRLSSRPPAIPFLEVAHEVKVNKKGIFSCFSQIKTIIQQIVLFNLFIHASTFYFYLLIFLYKHLKHIVNKKHMVQCFWRENAVTSFIHSFSYICLTSVTRTKPKEKNEICRLISTRAVKCDSVYFVLLHSFQYGFQHA